MAENGDSLLREVQEELRREQLRKIWDNYNGLIVAGAVFLLLAVGGYKFLESRRIAAEQTAGAEFSAAENLSDQKKEDEAKKIFTKLAETGPAGYGAIAKLRLAGEQVKAGKIADAVATYDSLAEQSGADELLKSFAQLQAASLRLPDADYAEIQNRLTPLAGDDAPFFKSAQGIARSRRLQGEEIRRGTEISRTLADRPECVGGDAGPSQGRDGRILLLRKSEARTPAAAAAPTTTEGGAKSEPAKTEAKPIGAAGPDKKQ